ncbi:hypothetical protein QUF80_22810, partial [Desulfococcaceae bacterium HSG8]|nr:hypothetical protein [Desulfococcaceae bacterium HSG8]
MSGHFGIHMLQLPYWRPEHPLNNDKKRWVHFFREGENMDTDNLPEGMDTEEMRQAFGVLESFASNKEKYFFYLKRVEAARQERTWENAVERARRELEQERKEEERLAALLEKAGISYRNPCNPGGRCFFRDVAENMYMNNLSEGINTKEMRQAFEALDHFASNKEEFLLYLEQLEAARQEIAWKYSVKRARQEVILEQTRDELEQERWKNRRLAALLEKAGISYKDEE